MFVLEAVAGRFDHPGEEPSECAKRELMEEIGVASNEFVNLGEWLVSPGWTNERNHGFVALNCEEPKATQPDCIEEKFSKAIRLTLEQALDKVKDGSIIDAKTIILLSRVESFLANKS